MTAHWPLAIALTWFFGAVLIRRHVLRPPMPLRARAQRPYHPAAYLCPEPDCRRALYRPSTAQDVFACRHDDLSERHPHTWGAVELVSFYEAERAHDDLEPRLAAARAARTSAGRPSRPAPDRLRRR